MFMLMTLNYENYSPVGDIIVLAIIGIFLILIRLAYIKPTKEFGIFKLILLVLFLAAASDIIYRFSLFYVGRIPVFLIYFFRFIFYSLLYLELVLYVIYVEEALHLISKNENIYSKIAALSLVIFWGIEFAGSVFKFGFYITEENKVEYGPNLFYIEYMILVSLIIYIMVRYKKRIFRPIILAFSFTIIFAIFVMYIQVIHNQESYSVVTFLFPALSVLYLLHSNPYDPEMGTLMLDSFDAELNNAAKKEKKLIIMSLFLREFEKSSKKYPKKVRDTIRSYSENFLRNTTIFQISSGRMILIADVAYNPDYGATTHKMLDVFKEQYEIYKYDYKIVIMNSYNSLKEADDYISFIQYIEARMFENEICYADETLLDNFFSHKYIVDELADISEKGELHDERVVVFCQPVLNLRTGKFDTAEALMRLRLEKTGMVYPDRFIPIAEKHNYVHMLSLIILAKTCTQVRKLLDNGYNVSRISVNFSIMDIREKKFSENVKKIIEDSGISFDKIAIEITESQNEKDFSIVKEKILELKDSGITFYLDDFGTGYSNFERIMQLPFDIVKFDRSLVIASTNNAKSETMVSYMAHMFTDMNYSVLYEGIEDEKDEALCKSMYARYLQGYKYSKPIPIEELTKYFEKSL